ncbi:MAG: hypothetical protein KDC44_06310 [Phaeodactylibacter sp.]|nr:hypothetical protein [Phaeodactylibacter sp.]
MHILAIVCENGLGHFKRMTGLLWAWCEKYPDTRIDLVAEQWQLDLTGDWDKTAIYHRSGNRVFTGITAPGVRWSQDVSIFDSGQLTNWEDRLLEVDSLQTADLVLSDNLVGVLHHRPDAILIGSFLWSEVLKQKFPKSPVIQRFADRELALLQAQKPYMLGVEPLIIPEIRSAAKAFGFPWFGQADKRSRRQFRGIQRIAILAGATTAAQEELEQTLQILLQKPGLEIALPDRLIPKLQLAATDRIVPFGFELVDFEACDLVFCRPGVGTLTDCVVTNTPMVLFYEPGNYEMIHNARQLEKAGIAVNLGAQFDGAQLLEVVERFEAEETYQTFQDHLAAQATNGYPKIVEWLAVHSHKMTNHAH